MNHILPTAKIVLIRDKTAIYGINNYIFIKMIEMYWLPTGAKNIVLKVRLSA